MPTYNPVTGVNTAMMSQFCSKFWGLLSPTHSDSSQNGAENISSVSGGRDEMGEGGQKLQPHSGGLNHFHKFGPTRAPLRGRLHRRRRERSRSTRSTWPP